MKKIKINERQASLLKSIQENEESGIKSAGASIAEKIVRIVISGISVVKFKDRIGQLIARQDPDAIVKFYETTGKIVGNVKGIKFDSIKRDIRALDSTISVEDKPMVNSLKEGKKNVILITKEQYNRIFASNLLTESEIKEPTSIDHVTENEESPELHTAVIKLISDIYNNPTQAGIDQFWKDKGLTWDDIEKYLCNIGLLIPTEGDKYIIAKKYNGLAFTTPAEAIQAIESQIKYLIEKKGIPASSETENKSLETEDSGYPAGAGDSSDAPFNKRDMSTKPIKSSAPKLETVAMNNEIAILKDNGGTLYAFFYFDINRKDFGEYADRTRTRVGTDDSGEPDFEYSDDFEIDANAINHFVNDKLSVLSKGEGADAFEQGVNLVKIDSGLKNELMSVYDKDKGIINALSSIKEEETPKPDVNKIVKDKLSASVPVTPLATKKTPEQIKKALADIRNKELGRRKETGEVEEMTSAGGSSGAFTGPLKAPIIKKDVPVIGEETIDEVTVAGSAVTGGSSGPYDANALPGIGRNGEFKKPKASKAEKTPQWAGGAFVKQPDCSKLNNNKSAQSGGCNQGASSLKTVKASGSVNAPSLAEGIYETIAKKTGKTIEEVKKIIDSKLKPTN